MLMIILLQNMPLTGFPTEQTALRIRVSTNLTNKVKSLLRKHRKTLERKRIKYPLIHQIIGKGFCQSGTKSNTGGEIHHKGNCRRTKDVVKATFTVVKAIIVGTKALIYVLIAYGWISVVIIFIVVLLGCAVSLFGGEKRQQRLISLSVWR